MSIENLYNDAGKNKGAVANLYAQQKALATVNAPGYKPPAQDPVWQAFNKPAPFPNAIPGSPQDQANQKASLANINAYQGYQNDTAFQHAQHNTLGNLALMLNVGALTAGAGAVLAPAVGAAVGGGTAGTIAGGAATGAAGGVVQGALTGQNIGKSALIGGVLGGVGAGLKPIVQGATGLTGASGNVVNSGITGAGTGAVRGALTGQGALSGALSGAQGGATNAAGNAVAGSIFNSGNTVNSNLTQNNNPAAAASNNNMADDGLNYIDPNQGNYATFDPTTGGVFGGGTGVPFYDPSGTGYNPGNTNYNVQGGGTTLGGGYSDQNGNTTAGNLTGMALQKFLQGMGGQQSGGSNSNTGILSTLASLLGGGQGLSQLLGIGVNGAAGAVNSQASKYAANQYAGQTKYNPYNIQGPGGSTTFNGTTATSSLNPAMQGQFNQLGQLANSSAQSLQGGQQQAANGYFNQLQAQDRDSNNKMFQSNLDNQFANGVLGSTAGQYQSQAALGAINQKTLQDQTLAQQFGQNQQQQQLAQLTAGLGGQNQINSQQLQQMQTGGNLGYQASNANSQAYKPLAGANANSNLGNILSSIGNSGSQGMSNNQNILQLLGLG